MCDYTVNLASFIGRGTVKERAQLTGAAYFIDFEITVSEAAKNNVRGSMALPLQEGSEEESENSSSSSPNPRLQSEVLPKKSSDSILNHLPPKQMSEVPYAKQST